MGIIKSFFENVRKLEGLGGKVMLSMMNSGHNQNALWGGHDCGKGR
ncbi:hypothetical protein OXPF_34330 [Oxobacter pfennigii]|uniref:Uncharacterized protein n=1 Tax=Oxobacter pfennigii TaxID=36849 RepID=A0A0P8W549_9CLOT|nr:hypothetical protein OXPF_34330 [Oxobacter pfennigii]